MAPRRNGAAPVSYWSIPPEWQGGTAYIIAGGTSVAALDLTRLKGRRVIAVNSSYQAYREADYLAFGDHRWWLEHRKHLEDFAGRIVTTANIDHPKVLRLKAEPRHLGVSVRPDTLVMGRTSLHAAINLAFHLGAVRIVLLGADMCAVNGKSHHHKEHRWPTKPGCWDRQMVQLKTLEHPLRDHGVEVFNASPISRIDWWPKITFEETLAWPTQS